MLKNLVLRHHLEVLLRRKPKPRLHKRDRILWVCMPWLWPAEWTRHLKIVRPDTVIGSHRRGWRLYLSWRSRNRLGRPRLSPEVRELIARMSREPALGQRAHPRRAAQARDRGQQSIDSPLSLAWSQAGEKSELENLPRNQIKGIWGADLFVVQTIGFQTLYMFLFISHERMELIDFNLTASPTAEWIWRQAIEATAWGRQPQYLDP